MTDVKELLYKICDTDETISDDTELIESGILDSYAFIELFSSLEDEGIFIQPTRVDLSRLNTVKGIEQLIEEYR